MSEQRQPLPATEAAVPSAHPEAAGNTPSAAEWFSPKQPFDPRYKSPRWTAALSLVPGLGQIYIGYYVRGFVFAASILLLILAANTVHSEVAPAFGFAAFFVWLFQLVDAGRMAALYNHAVAGSRAIDVPSDFKMPAMGGSIAGGALLVAFGLIALSNTALGFDLRWLDAWWPIFPVGLGIYLLVRGVMDRAG